jgi:hypothetical protein
MSAGQNPAISATQNHQVTQDDLQSLANSMVANTPPTSALSFITRMVNGMGLLNSIAIAGLYGMYWLATTGIPKHLDQIQAGYQKISDDSAKSLEAHGKKLEQIEVQHREEVQSLQKGFEKNADRTESLLREIFQKPKGGAGNAAAFKPAEDGSGGQ